MKKEQFILKKGNWKYDNNTLKKVAIIKQNWDYYFEEGYTDGDPHLNSDGFAFYVVFDEPLNDGLYKTRSETLYSLKEAVDYAEKKVGEIIWTN